MTRGSLELGTLSSSDSNCQPRKTARAIYPIGLLATVIAVIGMASASGAGVVTFTQTFHHATASFPVNAACGAPAGTLTTTFNGVFHVAVTTSGVSAGTGMITITETGSMTLVPFDPTQPTLTGKFTLVVPSTMQNTSSTASLNLQHNETTLVLVTHFTGSGMEFSFHVVEKLMIVGLPGNPAVSLSFEFIHCD